MLKILGVTEVSYLMAQEEYNFLPKWMKTIPWVLYAKLEVLYDREAYMLSNTLSEAVEQKGCQ